VAERKPARLLLVDDHPQNLQVLGEILTPEGYSLALATSGAEALEFAWNHRLDLILLDVMMPGMSGLDVCKRLKLDERTRDVPVIFLTARNETGDIVAGFGAGAVDYIGKPFHAAELLARVRAHSELKRAREEIKTLRGFLPVCANCKSIRDEEGVWRKMEDYIASHSDAVLSHGLCPDCLRRFYPEYADRIIQRNRPR